MARFTLLALLFQTLLLGFKALTGTFRLFAFQIQAVQLGFFLTIVLN